METIIQDAGDSRLLLPTSPSSSSSPSPSSSSSSPSRPVDKKAEALCRVCGDRSSGKHYGVFSCDGCRGFFKRSVRRNMAYACKESGACVVDLTRRNQCQACRFQKCLQVRMNRNAVQHERAPRCYQYGRRSPHRGEVPASTPPPPPHPAPRSREDGRRRLSLPAAFSHDARRSVFAPVAGEFSPAAAAAPRLPRAPPAAAAALPEVMGNHFLQHLLLAERAFDPRQMTALNAGENGGSHGDADSSKTAEATADCKLYPTSGTTAENVYECAARLLFMTVKWARGIPAFLSLPFRDQAILLEESWSDLFVLSACQWAIPIEIESILSSDCLYNMTDVNGRMFALQATVRQLLNVVRKLRALQTDTLEYACLKALVLFKPESGGLREAQRVETVQDESQLVLLDVARARQPSQRVRFGKLLLTLPHVKAIDSKCIEEIFFRRTIGSVPIERLLCDMFKSS